MPILVTRSSMPDFDKYVNTIRPIFESRWLTNMGPIHQKLEKRVKEYLEVPNVSLFVNGHSALEIAYQLFCFPKGSEVITTPFTFVSTVNAIVQNGLKPVFCDIRACDYTIDVDLIEKLITDRTVAIAPVHVYGNICDVITIENIAKKYGLKVIYDSAHAFGVKFNGIGIGNYGDLSMFSFHATKVFHTIEGGCLVFKDESFSKELHDYKDFGLDGTGDVYHFSGNAKMDEFRAAMGLCNIENVDEYIENRKVAYERYNERLANKKGIHINGHQQGVTRNYAYYPVYFESNLLGYDVNKVVNKLKENNIFARRYFYPAINEMKIYKDTFGYANTPVASNISKNILCLPLYDGLTNQEVDKICDIVLEC